MTFSLTSAFFANARGITFLDGSGVTWSFNKNTNSVTASASGGGAGTVTSVGVADTSTVSIYSVTGTPVTASGTIDLALKTQNANLVFAGPTTGAAAQPGFRALVLADLPTFTALSNSNITVDTHAALPTGVGVGPNDEFEGAALDTGGTRYSGATAWAWLNQGTATATMVGGSAVIVTGAVASNINSIIQALPAQPWTYQSKFTCVGLTSTAFVGGFVVNDTTNNKQVIFGVDISTSAVMFWGTSSASVLATTHTGSTWSFGFDNVANCSVPAYFQLSYSTASGFVFSISRTGLPGSWVAQFTVTLAASGLTNVNSIGLTVTGTSAGANLTADWFRRTA